MKTSRAVLLWFVFLSQFVFAQTPPATESSAGRPAEVRTYDQLVHAIRSARTASRARIEAAVRQEKVREAWEIGRLIDAHILFHKERAEYGKQVLERLAADLGVSRTELYLMLEFARTFRTVPPTGQLSWSHYRELLSINDEEERKELTQKAEREHWSRSRLRSEISRRQAGRNVDLQKTLNATPGKVGVYRVVKAGYGKSKDELVIDLGFSNYFKPQKNFKFKVGDFVRLENGKLKKIEASTDDLFTFRVEVLKVIDGDTFSAAIDLGFGFTTVQTLRLRGLDAPEIESKEGMEAKQFLEDRLKNSSPVLIRTVRPDKYDRYLTDLWAGNTYVNRELVELGHALPVED